MTEPKKCPYCGLPITTPVIRKIIDRGFNYDTRKQYVRTTQMEFCSAKCGGNYQMGCEG